MTERLSYEEFVKQAILKLRTGDYKGIHTVYSGFNEAFRKYFDGANPIEITTQLAQEKKIVIRPVKGGVMLYLPEDVPQTSKAEQVLKKFIRSSFSAGLADRTFARKFFLIPS